MVTNSLRVFFQSLLLISPTQQVHHYTISGLNIFLYAEEESCVIDSSHCIKLCVHIFNVEKRDEGGLVCMFFSSLFTAH